MERKIVEQFSPNASVDVTTKELRKERNKEILKRYAPIDYVTEINVEWPYTTINYCPLSDLHAGNINARLDAFDTWVDFVEKTYNSVTILNGDILDNATQNSISNTHDENLPPEEVVDYLVDKLLPLAKQNKIVAITPGNHDSKSGKRGVDTNVSVLKSLAERLGVPFVEHNVLVKFEMPIANTKNKQTVTIAAMHGAGKAGGVAGALDTISEQMSRVFNYTKGNIDICDAGHFHAGGVQYKRFEYPEKDKFNRTISTSSKDILIVSNYSFQDNSDYAAEANFGGACVNSWGILISPKQNIYYKTNEHENNKYIPSYSIYKVFSNNLNLSLSAKLIAEKFKQEPVMVTQAKLAKQYGKKSAEEILKEANKQGGISR